MIKRTTLKVITRQGDCRIVSILNVPTSKAYWIFTSYAYTREGVRLSEFSLMVIKSIQQKTAERVQDFKVPCVRLGSVARKTIFALIFTNLPAKVYASISLGG